jgi:hypothetical protein
MTDSDLLTLIKGSAAFKSLADQGLDNELADAINASFPAAVPITVGSLTAAAPITLAAIAGGQNPLSEMDVIASRIRAGDAAGVGQWADTLLMLGKMSQTEHDAVERIVSAAAAPDSVSHDQVSRVLNAIRPTDPAHGHIVALPINWS